MTQEEIRKLVRETGEEMTKQGDPVYFTESEAKRLISIAIKKHDAERSRLLEEAGMPDDSEIKLMLQPYSSHEQPVAEEAFKRMRSRCTALLMKERVKALRFAEWMFYNRATADLVYYGDGKWSTGLTGFNYQSLTTSQLYDLFESQRKKGDSERKVENQNEEG